jgi:hypothetical protein
MLSLIINKNITVILVKIFFSFGLFYPGRYRILDFASFDKSIATIRIAMDSLVEVINSVEDDWILYEVLMQHKNMLHTQIDILLKEKKI